MDVSGIASAATEMAQAKTADAVQITMLKKAIDLQAQGAMQLIDSVAQVLPNNPPHLGNKINTFA
ncbi:MAG: YjfB family protein [Sterolibacterium sp.]